MEAVVKQLQIFVWTRALALLPPYLDVQLSLSAMLALGALFQEASDLEAQQYPQQCWYIVHVCFAYLGTMCRVQSWFLEESMQWPLSADRGSKMSPLSEYQVKSMRVFPQIHHDTGPCIRVPVRMPAPVYISLILGAI